MVTGKTMYQRASSNRTQDTVGSRNVRRLTMKERPFCTCCSGPEDEDIRMLEIRGILVGVVGLEGAFFKVMRKGLQREEEVKEVLLEEISTRNYVPRQYEGDYKEALFQAYRSFLSGENEQGI